MNEQLTLIYGYLYGMWHYRWTALLITWVVALAGWIYVASLPNQYSANAVVYIDTTSIMKPLLKGLAIETDTKDEMRVMSRVLLSRENLQSVVRETDMDLEAESEEDMERIVEGLAGAIKVKGGGRSKRRDRSNIYEIRYKNASPERAYRVVSTLLTTMIESTLNATRTDTVVVQKFLDTQIAEHEQRLAIAEQKLADFKKANFGFMPDEKGGYYKRLQRAQDSMDKTRAKIDLAERRIAELNKQLSSEDIMLGSGNSESAYIHKYRRFQEKLYTLLNQFTEEHPDVQAVRSAMADLKANYEAGGSVGFAGGDVAEFNPVYQQVKVELSKAGVEVETLKIQLAQQAGIVKKLKDSIDVIPEVEANLTELNRDYDVTHKRYLKLVERKESAQLAQSAGQSASDVTFRIIEPPIVPTRASGPDRLLLLSQGLAIAFGAGLGWSLLNFLLQPTFIGLRQLRLKTGLPVLGSVSLYLSSEHRKKRRMQLASFITATLLLICIYGGAVLSVSI